MESKKVADCSAHKEQIPGFSIEALATEVGDLRYDALAHFLRCLSDKLSKDSGADADRGRAKLAHSLAAASADVAEAAADIDEAWRISAPFMK